MPGKDFGLRSSGSDDAPQSRSDIRLPRNRRDSDEVASWIAGEVGECKSVVYFRADVGIDENLHPSRRLPHRLPESDSGLRDR